MCLCECLTLPPATTDFPEAGSLTQPVEPLLFDQLHDLWLDLLPQLPVKRWNLGLRERSSFYTFHMSSDILYIYLSRFSGNMQYKNHLDCGCCVRREIEKIKDTDTAYLHTWIHFILMYSTEKWDQWKSVLLQLLHVSLLNTDIKHTLLVNINYVLYSSCTIYAAPKTFLSLYFIFSLEI